MRRRKGLTLIELLIVVIILGALAAIAIPRITTSATTVKKRTCQTNISTLNTAIEMYKMDKGAYPSYVVLTTDPNYFPDGGPVCPFGTMYSINSANHRILTINHVHP